MTLEIVCCDIFFFFRSGTSLLSPHSDDVAKKSLSVAEIFQCHSIDSLTRLNLSQIV